MRRQILQSASTCAVVILAASCNDSPTAPGPGHPLGKSVSSVALAHGPWGVAVSSRGIAYVTRPLTDSVARISYAGSTPTVIGSFQVGSRPDEVVFNASGSTAYVTNINSATVGVINTSTGRQTNFFFVPAKPLRVVVGADQKTLYVTLDNGNLVVLDATTGAVRATVGVGTTPNGIALNAAAARLYVSATDGTVTEINTTTNAFVRTLTIGGTPQDLAILPGRNALCIANESGWVELRDLVSGLRTDSISVPAAFRLAVTPDGKQVWTTQSGVGKVTLIDVASFQVIDFIATNGVPRHVAFAPGGAVALVANETGLVQLIR